MSEGVLKVIRSNLFDPTGTRNYADNFFDKCDAARLLAVWGRVVCRHGSESGADAGKWVWDGDGQGAAEVHGQGA